MPEETPTATSGLLTKLTGRAKQTVGRLVGNDELVDEGALQEQKVEAARAAAALEAEAEQAEQVADVTAAQAQNRIDQAQVEAELAERARAEQIDRAAATERDSVEHAAARKEDMAEQLRRADDAQVAEERTDLVADRVDGALEAAEIDADARQAEATARALAAAQENLEHTSGA